MIEEHIRKKIASAFRDIPQADTFVSNRLSLLIEELEKWNKKLSEINEAIKRAEDLWVQAQERMESAAQK